MEKYPSRLSRDKGCVSLDCIVLSEQRSKTRMYSVYNDIKPKVVDMC